VKIMTPNGILGLIWETILNPASAARTVLSLRVSRENLWLAVLLATVLSGLVGGLSQMVVPNTPMIFETVEGPVALNLTPSSPMMQGLFVGASLVMMGFSLYFTGRALGGQGTFPGTLALMAWLQVVMVAMQIATLVLIFVAPVVAAFLVFVSLVVFVRSTVVFVNELHGFQSIGRAIVTVLLAFLGVVVGFTIILLFSGVGASGVAINA
jgi:hypothetical protein